MRTMPLIAAALMAATAGTATAQTCSRDTLLGFVDGVGEVLRHEPLPEIQQSTMTEEVQRIPIPCGATETEEQCSARAETTHGATPREGQSIRVEVVGEGVRILTELLEDGEERRQYFDTYEDAASYLEAEGALGHEIVLVQAKQVAGLTNRRAEVIVTEEHIEMKTMGLGLRLQIRASVSYGELITALQEREKERGVSLVSWQLVDDGTVQLDLRCPGPTP